MGDLSRNFNRSEFACKGEDCCGHSAPVHPDLVEALQALRDRIGKPLSITSGFRCNRHNQAISGEDHSFHTLGMAADVACPDGIGPEELAALADGIELFHQGGIGIYPSWVHLDVRKNGKARWRK
jgi:zinc D-Ala-D-Ala carboxypeptidase